MLLAAFSVALAGAPEAAARPFAEAVADLGPPEVEMPPMDIRATQTGRSMWSRVPDGLAVELALSRLGISVTDASVISVVENQGQTQLSWSNIATGEVRMHAEHEGRVSVCTQSVGAGIWGGAAEVALYAPTPSGADSVAASPGFLLVQQHPRIGALISLAPGDAATVTDLRHDGKLIREVVSVVRPSGTVRVERKKGDERICYLPPARNIDVE